MGLTGKYFADFEIPEELSELWRYMHNMYQLDAFTQSCPADQDIINHYKQQQVSPVPLILFLNQNMNREWKEIFSEVLVSPLLNFSR